MADDVFRRVAGEGKEQLQRGKRLVEEFKTFILRGNALDLAVGVVIGAAFNRVVEALVKSVLTPIISLPGKVSFDNLGIGLLDQRIGYGRVLTEVLNLLLVGIAVYFFVVRPMNKLRERRKAEEPVEEETRECPECLSKIPVSAKRCAFCTSKVGTAA